jgi:hypothetical protein
MHAPAYVEVRGMACATERSGVSDVQSCFILAISAYRTNHNAHTSTRQSALLARVQVRHSPEPVVAGEFYRALTHSDRRRIDRMVLARIPRDIEHQRRIMHDAARLACARHVARIVAGLGAHGDEVGLEVAHPHRRDA